MKRIITLRARLFSRLQFVMIVCLTTISLVRPALGQQNFITVWNTTLIGSGGTANNQILLPATGNFAYYWESVVNSNLNGGGMGQDETIITFPSPGIYRVEMLPVAPNPFSTFQITSGDRLKLLEIEQWGSVVWSSMARAFQDCINLTITASDAPDLSEVTVMLLMFRNAISMNADLSQWDVSHVMNMQGLFWGASSFNGDISGWDVGNVTNMTALLAGASAFNHNLGSWNLTSVTNLGTALTNSGMDCENYSRTLIGWSGNENTPNNVNMSASGLFYGPDALAARARLLEKGWQISGDEFDATCSPFPDDSFVSVWDTRNTGGSATSANQVLIPATGDFHFYWENTANASIRGGGTGSGNLTLTLPEPGIYRLEILPATDNPISTITHTIGTDRTKLLAIERWGAIRWSTMARAFEGCENLVITAPDVPDLSDVRSMLLMFHEAVSVNADFSGWDVSQVTNMQGMFWRASSFNGDVTGWDVSNVTNMSSMFARATAFNRDLGGWNLSSLTNAGNMLANSGLDCHHYTSTLAGWANHDNTPENLSLHADGLFYGTTAVESRNELLSKGWEIAGDALDPSCNSLPVKLVSLQSHHKEGVALLEWQTASEVNTSHFDIERSSDATVFEVVGSVVARGSDKMGYNYRFADPLNFPFNTVYYRLRMIDTDGSYDYSSMVVVSNRTPGNAIIVYPNPAAGTLHIKSPNSGDITFYTLEGRAIRTEKVGSGLNTYDVSHLTTGLYLGIYDNQIVRFAIK